MRADVPRGAALGALAALGAGALAALAVLARGGELTDTDWRVIGSLVVVLYCGSTIVAALTLRGLELVALLPAASAVALLAALWVDWEDYELVGKIVGTALVLSLAVLLLASLRLLTVFTRRSVWAFYLVVSALIVLTALLALVLLWSWNPAFLDGGGGENVANTAQRILIALFALSIAGYLATPLLARVLPPQSP